MNDNTAKLLEKLAQKLGTTSDYLWRVLLKQASISATTSLIQIILMLLFGAVLWSVHLKFTKKDKNGDNVYYRFEAAGLVLLVVSIAFIILFPIILFIGMSDIINGYFNPEYWALDKILDTIK